ncbi:hypothetical protein AFLA_001233 [Aspergillus flavus NRRL3357]|nr:hypothetical protein AFLA_001233 [Aspergillus flavus NRRL3357]
MQGILLTHPLSSPHLSQRIDTKQIDTFLSDMKALGPSTLTQYRRYSPSQLHHYPPLTHTHVFNEGLSTRARPQFPSPMSVCWRRRPQDGFGWFLSLNVLLCFMVPMLDFKRQPTFFSSLSPHLAWKASSLSLSLDHLR